MAFKEIALFSSLMMLSIISYNDALLTIPVMDSYYRNVQASLYNMQESEMNLMNESQKLYDMQNEYLNGKLDPAAVYRAYYDLMNQKMDWMLKVMKYMYDSSKFEPGYNYPYGPDPTYHSPNPMVDSNLAAPAAPAMAAPVMSAVPVVPVVAAAAYV